MINRNKLLSIAAGLIFCYLFILNFNIPNSNDLKMNLQAQLDFQTSNKDEFLDIDEEPVSYETNSSDIISQFKKLQVVNFVGEWDATSSNNQLFSNFENSKGKIRLNFFNELADANSWNYQPLNNMTYIQILIVDGEYYDDKVYQIKLNDSIYTVLNSTSL